MMIRMLCRGSSKLPNVAMLYLRIILRETSLKYTNVASKFLSPSVWSALPKRRRKLRCIAEYQTPDSVTAPTTHTPTQSRNPPQSLQHTLPRTKTHSTIMSEPAPQISEADAQPVANGVAPDATTEMPVDSTADADITMTDSHDVKIPTCN
jgi:hypothetical protein